MYHNKYDRSLLKNKAPSITTFRNYINSLIKSEISNGYNRNILILGIDGVRYDLAVKLWNTASISMMKSVFPPTSSAAWLSSISGLDVNFHGIPGVVFKTKSCEKPINIFNYRKEIIDLSIENIFSDAKQLQYIPLSIVGDLEKYNCSWRDLLLMHSKKVWGHSFYTCHNNSHTFLTPDVIINRIRAAIFKSLEFVSNKTPGIIWCFIDMDLYVHYFGYDNHVLHFLKLVEMLAGEMTDQNMLVISHSDHGLVRTNNDTNVEQIISSLQNKYFFDIGGAGRSRWIYPKLNTEKVLFQELKDNLPASIIVDYSNNFFPDSNLLSERVGKIMLVAQQDEFIVPECYKYDHGSLTDSELHVPLAKWTP